MYLKNVRMENFKSFNKRIDIPIEKGYTNITGPNGSGKSNIADAILFVLGPKSSKEMRAGRLTDLIFNGGQGGKPADFCKVSLTFDNHDRGMPRDDDEVTFTRKVQRSDNDIGYNSYFYLNGRSSSLTEFQELLSHARITAGGYNLVQQGDISRIVEMSDYERRKILDQISGISDYDKDIEDAEKKKEEVKSDLDRINLLLDEIGKQVKELEEDRKQALKYQELSDRLKDARQMKAWKTIQEIQNDISSIEKDIKENEGSIKKLDDKKQAEKDNISKLREEVEKLEKELDSKGGEDDKKLREKLGDIRLEKGRAEDKIESNEETIKENKHNLQKLKKELEKSREELTSRKQDILKNNDKKEELVKELENTKEYIQEIKNKQSDSDDRIKELRKKGVKLRKRHDKNQKDVSSLQVEFDRKKGHLQSLQEKIAEEEEELEQIQFGKKEMTWELKELKKNDKGLEKQLKDLKNKFHKKRQVESNLSKDREDLEQRVNRLDKDYSHLVAQDNAAKSVKRGYSQGVERILEARDRGVIQGIHGTIAELASVGKEYETALQVAAGGRMQSIVVEDDATASRAIKYLKKKKCGRATFLPLNKMMSGRPHGKAIRAVKDENSVDFAINLVDYKNRYENVFWYVFGDTVVMKDIDSARSLLGGVRMVTLDGELLERSGAMVGGTIKRQMIGFEAPDRGELERVGKELNMSRKKLQEVENKLRTVRSDIQNIQNQIRDLQSEAGKTGSIGTLQKDVDRCNKKIKKRLESINSKKDECKEIAEEREKIKQQLIKAKNEGEDLRNEMQSISEKVEDISPEELSRSLGKLKDREVELNKKLSAIESDIKIKEQERERLEDDIDEFTKYISDLKSENKRLSSTIKKKNKVVEEKRKEIKALNKRIESVDDELKELRDKKEKTRERLVEARHSVEGIDTKIEAKKSYLHTLEQKLNDHVTSVSEVREDINESMDYEEEDIPSMKELKNKIRRSKEAMEKMEPVNMTAIDVHKEKKERKDNLQKEYTKLEERREELDKLIDELDKKKKVGLLKVKNDINDNFKEVYHELSGGEAHLELEDPDSPFDGGLIIKARPPGKKVHRIQALSGGEKSLVSMAFIFSIQRYNPSPFYLLDEIDQNLDGVNAEKVADMIKRNSLAAQFIQISLRKATLKKSDHIIGVTMYEKGRSDIIMKVNIGDKEKDIPLLTTMSSLETEAK
ncbi:MAG: chromosome segregation protein SMC [Thermoplasmata archaeon]